MRMSLERLVLFRMRFLAIVSLQFFCAGAMDAAEPAEAWLAVTIERQMVLSSILASIGYSEEMHVLEIEFRSGAIYCYREVPPDVFSELMKADSKGRFFVERIRQRYSFRRMNDARR